MVTLLQTIRLAQLILKHKFPSVDKPLRIEALGLIFGSLRYVTNIDSGEYYYIIFVLFCGMQNGLIV